jgi:hypothetical protein
MEVMLNAYRILVRQTQRKEPRGRCKKVCIQGPLLLVNDIDYIIVHRTNKLMSAPVLLF